jgi:chromosome segregation ATPase
MATLTPQEIAEAASQAAKLTAALEKAKDVFGSLSDEAAEVLDLSRKLEKSYKDLATSASLREQSEKKELSYSQQLQKQLEKIKKNQKEQADTSAKIQSELAKELSLQQQLLDEKRAANSYVKQLENDIKNSWGTQKTILEQQLEAAKETAKVADKQVDASYNLVKGLREAKIAADKLKDATEEEVKELEKAVKKAALKEFVAGFKKGLETLLGFQITLASIVSMLFNADKSTTKLANNLGISRKEAQALRSEYSEFVRNSNDLGLSTERLIEAQTNLSQELGIAVAFSKEELQTFNTLTKIMGVSNAAAAKLNLIAKASGTEYKNIQSNILKGAIAAKNQLNVAISNKDVFEEIGKLSAGILVKFQNSPAALGAAVRSE